MGGSKAGSEPEATGPYTVAEEKFCRCVVKVPRSGLDYASGWGWRLCAKCRGFIGWGVKE